jgi:putative pyoverdin transport system ATP-binding/permease protein
MKILWWLLRVSRRQFGLAILLGLAAGGCSARLIALINGALNREGPPDRALAIAFVGFGLGALVARAGSAVLLNRLNHGTVYELRMRLARQILDAPLRRLELTGTHRLMNLLQDDVFAVTQGLVQIPQMLINVAQIAGCLAYLAWLSGALFASLVAVLAVGLLLCSIPLARSRRLIGRARVGLDELFGHLHGLLAGIKELKLHRRRRAAFVGELLEPSAASTRDELVRAADAGSAAASLGSLLVFSLIGMLLLVFPAFGAVSRTSLVGYTMVVLYLQGPLDSVLALAHLVTRAGVAVHNLEAAGLALAEGGGEGAAAEDRPEPRAFGRIELAGVTHSYHQEDEDTRFTLGPIQLSLQLGEIVFLVGGNGSGKTTLAKVVTGLYAPESGEIRVDGAPVTDAGREQYRQLFAAVFSDFHLFEQLLGLGSPELAPRAQGWLQRLKLERKVKVEGGALSTTELSAGQRKRLALLTACLEDRPIYVFDEWAADQDPAFKEVFYKELLPDLKRAGKTALVISHDDRYFHLADRVLRLDSGRLVGEAEAPPAVAQRAS